MTGSRALQTAFGIAILAVAAGCGSTSPTAGGRTRPSQPSQPSPTMTAVVSHARTFAVSPKNLRVGKSVTFSGTGCPHRDLLFAGIDVGSTTPGTRVELIPRQDGSWRATVKVGDSTLLGTRTAVSACERASDHAVVFQYPPVTVHVTTFRRLTVTPKSNLAPGAGLHVVPTAPCPNVAEGGAFAAIIHPGDFPGTGDGIGPGAARGVGVDRAGKWSADLTVPKGTAAGHYRVTAYCESSRSYTAWYPTVLITVTG